MRKEIEKVANSRGGFTNTCWSWEKIENLDAYTRRNYAHNVLLGYWDENVFFIVEKQKLREEPWHNSYAQTHIYA